MALIRPSDIDTNRHLFDTFGNMETEVSAGWLIRFLTDTGDIWRPFTFTELQAYYAERRAPRIFEDAKREYDKAVARRVAFPDIYVHVPPEPRPVFPSEVEAFHFNRLAESQWNETERRMEPTKEYLLLVEKDGTWTYEVTDKFIRRCFASSGKIERACSAGSAGE